MGSDVFRDPYADLALSQLLDLSVAVTLTRAERAVLVAAVRSEIIVNKEIHRHLKIRVDAILKEISAARVHLPRSE